MDRISALWTAVHVAMRWQSDDLLRAIFECETNRDRLQTLVAEAIRESRMCSWEAAELRILKSIPNPLKG
jgi:hypothetical protein